MDAVYDSKTLKQSSISMQTILVVFFYAYLYLETLSFDRIQGISQNIHTFFKYETPWVNSTIDDVTKPGDIGDWLKTTATRLYNNKDYEIVIPDYLVEELEVTSTHGEH